MIADIVMPSSFPFAGITLIRWVRVIRFWTLRCFTTPLTRILTLETSFHTVKKFFQVNNPSLYHPFRPQNAAHGEYEGFGVSRLSAAVIEHNHDQAGIIWPKEIAPFHAVIIPTSGTTLAASEELYYELKEAGAQVLWDDRNMSAGVKFNDADLIGIPFKVIVGDTFLKEGKIEIKSRREGTIEKMTRNKVSQSLRELIEDAR